MPKAALTGLSPHPPRIARGGWLDALRFIVWAGIILYHFREVSPVPLPQLHPVLERGYLLIRTEANVWFSQSRHLLLLAQRRHRQVACGALLDRLAAAKTRDCLRRRASERQQPLHPARVRQVAYGPDGPV